MKIDICTIDIVHDLNWFIHDSTDLTQKTLEVLMMATGRHKEHPDLPHYMEVFRLLCRSYPHTHTPGDIDRSSRRQSEGVPVPPHNRSSHSCHSNSHWGTDGWTHNWPPPGASCHPHNRWPCRTDELPDSRDRKCNGPRWDVVVSPVCRSHRHTLRPICTGWRMRSCSLPFPQVPHIGTEILCSQLLSFRTHSGFYRALWSQTLNDPTVIMYWKWFHTC